MSESIKIRVTKEEKETLKYLSKKNNENISAYLLRKGMEDDGNIYQIMPDKIEVCSLLNEVFHGIVVSVGRQRTQEVSEIFQKALKKYREEVL